MRTRFFLLLVCVSTLSLIFIVRAREKKVLRVFEREKRGLQARFWSHKHVFSFFNAAYFTTKRSLSLIRFHSEMFYEQKIKILRERKRAFMNESTESIALGGGELCVASSSSSFMYSYTQNSKRRKKPTEKKKDCWIRRSRVRLRERGRKKKLQL